MGGRKEVYGFELRLFSFCFFTVYVTGVQYTVNEKYEGKNKY